MNPQAARFLMQEIAQRANGTISERQDLEDDLVGAYVPPNRISPLRVHRFELSDAEGDLAVVGALNVKSDSAPLVPAYRRLVEKAGIKPDAKSLGSELLGSATRRYLLHKDAIHEYVLLAMETVFDRVLPDGQTLYRRTPRVIGIDNPSVRQWEQRQSHLYAKRRFLPDMIYGTGRFGW